MSEKGGIENDKARVDPTLGLGEDCIDYLTGLENGEFKLFLHPQINLITCKVIGAEALSRWVLPDGSVRHTYL